MVRTNMRIAGIRCQRPVKIAKNVLIGLDGVQRTKEGLCNGKTAAFFNPSHVTATVRTNFQLVRQSQPLLLILIGGILLTLLSLTGCTDPPHLGSILTVDDVDRYFVETEDAVCLQSDADSACIILMPEEDVGADGIYGPIIHIHPTKRIYVFYREGVPVLRAERPTGGGGGGGGGRGIGGGGGGGGTPGTVGSDGDGQGGGTPGTVGSGDGSDGGDGGQGGQGGQGGDGSDGGDGGQGGQGGNGGSNNGDDGNNGDDVDAESSGIDTHRVNAPNAEDQAWLVWLTYQDIDNDGEGDRPDDAGLDFNKNTGFEVTITDKDGNDITHLVGPSVVQTEGGEDGDALQFKIPTDSDVITITVDGLDPHETLTFTFGDDKVTSNPEIDDPGTHQDNPL